LRVGYFQFAPVFGERSMNLETVSMALGDAAADLIVLPELPFTGYSFRDRNELLSLSDDPKSSSIVEKLAELCAECGFKIVTGFAERAGEKCYNSALLVGPNGVESRYRKLHLFDREKDLFDPGDLHLEVIEAGEMRIGMMICFDWVFPEVTRTLALRGADIICHPANLVLSYCQRTMLSRCTENLLFAVTANRIGEEDRTGTALAFTGRSQVVAPGGDILISSGINEQELAVAVIDPSIARNKMMTSRNHILLDRRPDFYDR